MQARVISFINYKGGVAKTTTTYHVGCSLAQHFGKRVLLIDIDPQTNLTFLCAPVEKWQEQKKRRGTIRNIYGRFQEKQALDTKRFVWQEPIANGRFRVAGLDLIPCDIELLGEDLSGGIVADKFSDLPALKKHSLNYLRERRFLRAAIKEVEDKYDYVLIDCPPNLYLMTENALAASVWYVVTAIPDHLSTIGLNILKHKVDQIGKRLRAAETFAGKDPSANAVAQLGGVIFVRVRLGGARITNVHADKMDEVAEMLGDGSCFKARTTELIGYGEAAEAAVPVWAHPSANAIKAAKKREYERITEEFMKRFS